jgi:MSHA biogenesis protein MshE
MNITKIQLGKLLVEHKLITQEQLDYAVTQQQNTGKKLGQVLIELAYITEDQLLKLLSQQLKIPFIDLMNYTIDPLVAQKLPEDISRRFKCIVLDTDATSYMVGMSDPLDIPVYDILENALQKPIHIALVGNAELSKTQDVIYRHSQEISNLAEELSVEIGKSDYDISKLTEGLSMADTPVVRLLQTIFEDAVQVNASDVHIEPDEKVLRIRQRVDGVLQEHILKETNVADALALRLKLMSSMNIAEKRLPQDGRFSIRIKDKNFDVRVSTMPGQFGESVVMRLLNQSANLINLDRIGMPEDILLAIRMIMSSPHGLFLLTGPTGSGKTTSLYAMLNELNTPFVKIITVEDPVEYRLPRITQVQILPKINLDFARVLRSTLRQDPDIIMVGELRDGETAEIALRAAMTGHFVFATLHTNDAVSAPERLLDMGAKPYLVASVLRGILAQRLVRRICENCKKDHKLSLREEMWLATISPTCKKTFKAGAGCPFCNQTGYKGQIGLFELLNITPELANALRIGDTSTFHERIAKDKKFHSLVQSGLNFAVQGITTLDEVIQITSGESTLPEEEAIVGKEVQPSVASEQEQ